jgi:ribonuclease Z
MSRALGLSVLEPFPVKHVSLSTGLRLSGSAAGGPAAPWTVVFSGDTRPCPAVVSAARGATLMIHEATFEDELASDAEAKRHSTLSEALRVASDAGVYRTVLTHFSGRYPKIPVLAGQHQQQDDRGGGGGGGGGAEAGASDQPLTSMVGDSVAVGFDFMTVNLADLPWLPLVVPACDELLREEGFVGGEDGEDEGDAV